MRIGIISNPLSRKNRRALPELRELLNTHPEVVARELNRFDDLPRVLDELAECRVELLLINGGDGTVSAVMTEIFVAKRFESPPILGILAGGTSNTIAADVGIKGRSPSASLKRLLKKVRAGFTPDAIVTRHLIKVSYDESKTLVGMFFGTAGLCDAVDLRRRMFPQVWMPDSVAGAMTLVYVLINLALNRLEAGGILKGERMRIGIDAPPQSTEDYSIVIATTLRKIFLGGDPYWGKGEGVLKFTTISSPPQKLVRNAFRLLYGKDQSNFKNCGYFSENAMKITMQAQCRFLLDGEYYRPVADGPVELTGELEAKFVSF